MDYFSLQPTGNARTSPMLQVPQGNSTAAALFSPGSEYLVRQHDRSASPLDATKQSLPNTDPRSPYYISVPVPKAVPYQTDIEVDPHTSIAEKLEHDDNFSQLVREYPTDILMDRFHKWRKILKYLIHYLTEVAYAEEQIARIHANLKDEVKFPFLTDLEESTHQVIEPAITTVTAQRSTQNKKKPVGSSSWDQGESTAEYSSAPPPESEVVAVRKVTLPPALADVDNEASASSGFMSFGSGSIQDIQVILKKYHLSIALQQFKISKELLNSIVPKLEDLRKDLYGKIRDIKGLHNDFKTNILDQVATTKILIKKYSATLKYMDSDAVDSKPPMKPKHDPYLLKLQLDLHLKNQIAEENYLQEAFLNLQTSGLQLEKIVFSKIKTALDRYSALIDSEARLMIKNLCQELRQGIVTKSDAYEWDHFVARHPKCLLNLKSTDRPPGQRDISSIIYPNMKSPLAKCIRAGYLYKRSSLDNQWKKAYFILTSNYIHEFESSDFFKKPSNKDSEGLSQTDSDFYSRRDSETRTEGAMKCEEDVYVTRGSSRFVPTMSIPFKDAEIIHSTDTEFVLKGKPWINIPNFSSKFDGDAHKSNYKTEAEKVNASVIKSSKIAFRKLLTGHNNKKSSQLATENRHSASAQNIASLDGNVLVHWTFRIFPKEPTKDEERNFKKWVQDIKILTAYPNSRERARLIEDKLTRHRMKSHYNLKNASHVNGYKNEMSFGSQNSNSFRYPLSSPSSYSNIGTKDKNGRPRSIALSHVPAFSEVQPSNSYYHTPSVDDNGNLITFETRRVSGSQYSPDHVIIDSNGVATTSSPVTSAIPNRIAITSKGVSKIPDSAMEKWLAAPPSPSGKQLSTGMTANSEPSTAGSNDFKLNSYFALPVKDNSRANTPGSRSTASVKTIESNGESLPATVGGRVVHQVPSVKVNDAELHGISKTRSLNDPEDSFSTSQRINSEGNSTYSVYPYGSTQRNLSSKSLTTIGTTHPVVKHKSNKSITSLGGLKLKKISRPANLPENAGDDGRTINLRGSIYK